MVSAHAGEGSEEKSERRQSGASRARMVSVRARLSRRQSVELLRFEKGRDGYRERRGEWGGGLFTC
eukprot:scaffold228849_cov35-Tisochrysis_lutea.AAC.2